MLIVRIDGGLGNQMFIYTFAKYLEAKGYQVGLDASWYQNKENVNPYQTGEAQYTIRNLEIENYSLSLPIFHNFNAEHFFETNDRFFRLRQRLMKYVPKPLRRPCYKNNVRDDSKLVQKMRQEKPEFAMYSYFSGFFQSLSYIQSLHPSFLKDFTLCHTLSNTTKELQQKILNTHNSVFLHVRRGDYLLVKDHGYIILDIAYYNKALQILQNQLQKNLHIFIFSNDMAWCKNNLIVGLDKDIQENNTFTFVDNNNEGNAIQDLELMRSCKHAIIANSTFSWWGAYLIENPDKIVVAPSKVFYHSSKERMADFYPASWKLLDCEI